MRHTTGLRELLQAAHPPPDWVLAFEVQASYEDGVRYADAMAFDTRPKRGHALHGFELKVSRADLLHEIRNPAKHLPAAGVCDYWWLVLGDQDLMRGWTAAPPEWGILAPDERTGNLVTLRGAVRRGAHEHLLRREVIAGLLRRFTNSDYRPEAYWRGQVRAAEMKGYQKGRNAVARNVRSQARNPRANEGELDLP